MLIRSATGASSCATGRQALASGDRLAGEGRLVGLQPAHLDQPAVGRHVVAWSQKHDVAGHEFGPRQQSLGAVAADERQRDADLVERGEDPLHPRLRDVADGGVDRDDRENRDAVDEPAGGHRDDRGAGEQKHRKGGDLLPHDLEPRLRLRRGQAVGPGDRQPVLRLLLREPEGRGFVQRSDHLLHRSRVPRGVRREVGVRCPGPGWRSGRGGTSQRTARSDAATRREPAGRPSKSTSTLPVTALAWTAWMRSSAARRSRRWKPRAGRRRSPGTCSRTRPRTAPERTTTVFVTTPPGGRCYLGTCYYAIAAPQPALLSADEQ